MSTGYIMLDTPNTRTPQGTHPRRGGHRPSGTAIVHTSEGNWRSGVASLTGLVRTRGDYGCYHRACDWADIARYYPWEWETWQDSETNNWAVGIAAACKTTDWGNMPADVEEGYYRNMARMGADFVLYMRATYRVEVPRRRLSGAEARARVPGFCAHGDSGVARSDPGARFDWARFFKYINDALDGPKEDDVTLTPAQAKELAYIASPQFKIDLFTGADPREADARERFYLGLVNTSGTNGLIAGLAAKVDALMALVAIQEDGSGATKEEILAQLDASVKETFGQYAPEFVKVKGSGNGQV